MVITEGDEVAQPRRAAEAAEAAGAARAPGGYAAAPSPGAPRDSAAPGAFARGAGGAGGELWVLGGGARPGETAATVWIGTLERESPDADAAWAVTWRQEATPMPARTLPAVCVLPDRRVLVSTGESGVRILSADLQQVHTVVPHEQVEDPWGLAQLPDGRVLVSNFEATITMLEGFPPALMGPKPAAKPPKKKRGLAGGASASSSGGASSSSGPALKRGRSGAGPSNAAAVDSSSSSSEDEGAGAEAEPLV